MPRSVALRTCKFCQDIFKPFRPKTRFCSNRCRYAASATPISSLAKHFWNHISRCVHEICDQCCWEWERSRSHGYGQIRIQGKGHLTHRLAYELWHGIQLPPGVHVLHRCDNPPCCNPLHLFLGTQKDNVHDAARKGRYPYGERHKNTKISTAQVAQILQLRQEGETLKNIGERFGISQSQVSRIKLRQRRQRG